MNKEEIRIYENTKQLMHTIHTYGIDTVSDRGVCIICHALASDSRKGFGVCSPDHAEILEGLIK